MEGEATISIELLDKYREMEKALDSYRENCAFKIIAEGDRWGNWQKVLYFSSNKSEINTSMKTTISKQEEEIKYLKSEDRYNNQKITILEEEKERLTTKLEFAQRPLDISNWHFGLLGFTIACLIIFMICIWN